MVEVSGEYVAWWAKSFAITMAVELPLYLLLLRSRIPTTKRRLWAGAGVNLLTHPAYWFIAAQLLWFSPLWVWTLVFTAVVIVVEAALLAVAAGLSPLKLAGLGWGVAVALLPNALSLLADTLLNR